MLREIRLYGSLGRQFGRVHRFAVSTPAEAIRALCANFPAFEPAAVGDGSLGYRVTVGPRELGDVDRLHEPFGASEVIRVVPVIAGGKSKWAGILLGAALIASAFLTGGASLALVTGAAGPTLGLVTTTLGSLALGVGASLIIGGVAQMLAPQPKLQAGADAEVKGSYVFNGPQNTSAQGLPVPVGYGRMIIGSLVASASIVTEEYETSQPVPVVAGAPGTSPGITESSSSLAQVSSGGTGNGPYSTPPGYSWPLVPGDLTPNPTTPGVSIIDRWNLNR